MPILVAGKSVAIVPFTRDEVAALEAVGLLRLDEASYDEANDIATLPALDAESLFELALFVARRTCPEIVEADIDAMTPAEARALVHSPVKHAIMRRLGHG